MTRICKAPVRNTSKESVPGLAGHLYYKTMKRFALLWILFVYVFFAWNIFPAIHNQYFLRFSAVIQKKLLRKSVPPINNPAPPSPSPTNVVTELALPLSQASLAATARGGDKDEKRGFKIAANLSKVFLIIWIFLLCYSWGKQILSWLKIEAVGSQSEISIALGLGFLSYLILLFSSVRLIGAKWQFSLLLLLSCFSIKKLQGCFPNIKEQFIKWKKDGLKLNAQKIAVLSLLSLLFMGAFIPDQFYDTLSYHLAVPQAYINYGKIVSLPYNIHSSFPETAEMLFTLGLSIGRDDTLPLLFQLGFGILIFSLIIRRQSQNLLLPALAWLSCPLVMENLRFAKSDIFFSLMVTLTFLLLADWELNQGYNWIILAGIFSGFMIGTKYTGAFFVLFFLLLISFKIGLSNRKALAKIITIYLITLLFIAAPWFLKNYWTFQNPFYPFFQDLRGYRYMTADNWKTFLIENSQFFSSPWDWPHLFKVIWRQTFYGHEYSSMNFIGPIWLAFFPTVVFLKPLSSFQKYAIFFVLFSYFISTTQTTLARYFLLPVLPIGSLLIFSVIERSDSTKLFQKLLTIGILLQLLGWMPLLERVSYGRMAFWGLPEKRERNLYSPGYYDAFQWVNKQLPSQSMLLFVGETKSHRFQRKVIAPSVHNEHLLSILAKECRSGSELYEKLVELQFTHILFNREELLP